MNPSGKMSVKEMTDHLRQRSFCKVLDELPNIQQECDRALKLMCIVDYQIQKAKLYEKMENGLVKMKLMKFDYCLFKFYDYQKLPITRNCLLKCKECNLVAEYTDILTHMAISHNVHLGLKICAYCDVKQLSEHSRERNFEKCRDDHYEKYNIEINLTIYIVQKFYGELKEVAENIGVVVKRNKGFGGVGQAEIVKLTQLHGHHFPHLSVGIAPNSKKINDTKFFALFSVVAQELGIIRVEPPNNLNDEINNTNNGTNEVSLVPAAVQCDEDASIILISDDDENGEIGDSGGNFATCLVSNLIF